MSKAFCLLSSTCVQGCCPHLPFAMCASTMFIEYFLQHEPRLGATNGLNLQEMRMGDKEGCERTGR